MAYNQKTNPFKKTSCGRRYGPLNNTNNDTSLKSSPVKKSNEPRKTTKGKGRNFRTVKEGAGMTSKGVAAYKAKNPGSKLQTAVTGKVKAGSKDAARRKSFCARMSGMKGPMKDEKGRPTRKAMSLKRWKC